MAEEGDKNEEDDKTSKKPKKMRINQEYVKDKVKKQL
jgi:hypothetical protein